MKSLYDAFNDVATETTRWCYFNNANGLDVGSALKNNNGLVNKCAVKNFPKCLS